MKNKKYNNWKIIVNSHGNIVYKVELFSIETGYTYEWKSSKLNLSRNSSSFKESKSKSKNYFISTQFEIRVSSEKIAKRLYKKYCYFIKIQDSLINALSPYLDGKNNLITTTYDPDKNKIKK